MARDALKWREPWRASIARQPRFNPFGREVLRDFGLYALLFAGLCVVVRWGQPTTVRDLPTLAAITGGMSALIAVFSYVVNWLSPRSICSGPRGVLIVKGQGMMLLPWHWIAGFEFRDAARPPELRLHLDDGSFHDLLLSARADRKAIAAALQGQLDRSPRA